MPDAIRGGKPYALSLLARGMASRATKSLSTINLDDRV